MTTPIIQFSWGVEQAETLHAALMALHRITEAGRPELERAIDATQHLSPADRARVKKDFRLAMAFLVNKDAMQSVRLEFLTVLMQQLRDWLDEQYNKAVGGADT